MEYVVTSLLLMTVMVNGQMFPNAGVGPGIPSGPGPGTAMGPSGQASPGTGAAGTGGAGAGGMGAGGAGSFGPSGAGQIPPNPYFDQAATALPAAPSMDPSTENCILQFCGYGCTSPTYAAVCNSSATNVEVKKFFTKLQLFQGTLPLILMLEGKRDYPMDLFMTVKDNLVSLIIGKYDQFNTAVLKKLNLPTLLALQIMECKNVTVGPTDFVAFSRLRQLSFIKSPIFILAKKALQPLTALQLLALDGKYEPPFSALEIKHLEEFHCDCKYAWLRDYIRKNPLLIQPKKEGDLFKVGMLHSEVIERSDIFYPVNCTVGISDEPLDSEEETATPVDLQYSFDDIC